MNMKLHINTIAYAKAMGITLAEYNGGEYGSYAGEYRPLKFERIKYKMTNPDGSLDTVKVEDDFYRNTVRILDFMTIKNSKVLKVYGLGDLNSTNAVYQQAIRKAVYKVMNEYQRWGINAEQRNPITYNGEGTSDVAIGSWLNSADFTGSEGWNAINRLSLDKWELDALGNLYFNGMNVDALFETGESLSKTAISKVSESDNSGLTTNKMVARMIGAQLGGTDLATDTTTVPTDAELIATALQALYAGDEGLFLATENIKLKENPVGANERQAHENETIYVRSQATGTTEKIQFVNGQVVVLSTNVQIKDILKEYQDQLNALDTKKADLINVLLKDGSVELVDGYDPIKDYQIATLKKVKEYYKQAVNNIRGLQGSKTLSDYDELLEIISDRLAELENAEQLGNNTWSGSTPFAQDGTANILQDKDADGNSPITTAGRVILLDIKRTGQAYFGTVKLVAGDTNTQPLRIIEGGTTVNGTAKIGINGIVTITITTAGHTPQQYEVSKWVQSIGTSTTFATKLELDAERQARQSADNLKFDKTLANAIGGITDVVQLLTHLQAKVDTIINQDLLVDGKDYIVRKIANQKPVYYELNAVLKTDKAHRKGQTTIFNSEQVAPSKFADTTLFDKKEIRSNPTHFKLTSGTFGSNDPIDPEGHTNSSLIGSAIRNGDAIYYNKGGNRYIPIADLTKYYDAGNINISLIDVKWQSMGSNPTNGTAEFQGGNLQPQHNDPVDEIQGRTHLYTTITIPFTATNFIEVLSTTPEYKYIAKKDITFAEMGE